MSLSLLASLVLATSQVHVVDDDGGPGVDFTSIADAIAAALPGDVLLVAPGAYDPFVLDKPLTVLGSGVATVVAGDTVVVGLAATERAALVDMRVEGVRIEQCAGAVVLADVFGLWRSALTSCADVRYVRVQSAGWVFSASVPSHAGVHAVDSRVEVVDSHVMGEGGKTNSGKDGAAAVLLEGSSYADLIACYVEGGQGSNVEFGNAGSGGAGLDVDAPGSLRLVGSRVRGGLPGWTSSWPTCTYDGSSGTAVESETRIVSWRSEAYAVGYYWGPQCTYSPGSKWNAPPPVVPPIAPPTLVIEGASVAGSSVGVIVTGPPGAVVSLRASTELVVVPTPGVGVPILVGAGPSAVLGPIPAGGVLAAPFALPAEWPLGTVAALQVELNGVGEVQRSNSAPLVVR